MSRSARPLILFTPLPNPKSWIRHETFYKYKCITINWNKYTMYSLFSRHPACLWFWLAKFPSALPSTQTAVMGRCCVHLSGFFDSFHLHVYKASLKNGIYVWVKKTNGIDKNTFVTVIKAIKMILKSVRLFFSSFRLFLTIKWF